MTFPDYDSPSAALLKRSLKEGVFQMLHQKIVAGRYAPGEWLRQEEIATQLDVSQTPVREALDQLVSVGMAERVPYRGVRVLEFIPGPAVEAFTMRCLLECTTARLAATNATRGQVQFLLELVNKTKPLVDLAQMSELRQLNRQIHLGIAIASANSLLAKMYEMTANRFPDWLLYEYMFRHPELLASSLEHEFCQHREIVEAIARRDAPASVRHTLEHLDNLKEELVSFLGIPPSDLQNSEVILQSLMGIESTQTNS